jgi:hypothetical protein
MIGLVMGFAEMLSARGSVDSGPRCRDPLAPGSPSFPSALSRAAAMSRPVEVSPQASESSRCDG